MDWDMSYTRDLVRQQEARIKELERRILELERKARRKAMVFVDGIWKETDTSVGRVSGWERAKSDRFDSWGK